MQKFSLAANQDLTELWDQLADDYFARGKNPRAKHMIANSTAAMHLTAHLICGYIGNPHAILRPTMTLPQLAERLYRETGPVLECFECRVQIETFGQSGSLVADSRWLLALWSLVIDMATAASSGTNIEVNIGACGAGYEIEVGHDDRGWMAQGSGPPDLANSRTGQWLNAICPEWTIELPACPLGGCAVQVNIPMAAIRQAA